MHLDCGWGVFGNEGTLPAWSEGQRFPRTEPSYSREGPVRDRIAFQPSRPPNGYPLRPSPPGNDHVVHHRVTRADDLLRVDGIGPLQRLRFLVPGP